MKNKECKKLSREDELLIFRKFVCFMADLQEEFGIDFDKLPYSMSQDFCLPTFPNLKEEPCLILLFSFLDEGRKPLIFSYYGI